MTTYSGADEDTIGGDAGYRACTVCYPSAPVGEERSLPPKMLTDEEKQDAKRREGARAAREAKKAKAAANAPTATGEPLTVRSGTSQYPETLKTERTARTWAIDGVLNDASSSTPSNGEDLGDRRGAGRGVVRRLSRTVRRRRYRLPGLGREPLQPRGDRGVPGGKTRHRCGHDPGRPVQEGPREGEAGVLR